VEPEFAEAAGVLEMIKRIPEQMGEYSARLKLRLDEAARLKFARTEGEEKGRVEGRKEGRLEGRVITLQQLLGIPESTPEELSKASETELTRLAESLQQEFRKRNSQKD
jgi:hypothetical protein